MISTTHETEDGASNESIDAELPDRQTAIAAFARRRHGRRERMQNAAAASFRRSGEPSQRCARTIRFRSASPSWSDITAKGGTFAICNELRAICEQA
ncbi:MAG: hypothetical protein JWN04_821 [Myxococcaceae bacterium]|nr:hypothetical protein [Myxococcaceae bacterium]